MAAEPVHRRDVFFSRCCKNRKVVLERKCTNTGGGEIAVDKDPAMFFLFCLREDLVFLKKTPERTEIVPGLQVDGRHYWIYSIRWKIKSTRRKVASAIH